MKVEGSYVEPIGRYGQFPSNFWSSIGLVKPKPWASGRT